MQAGRLKLLLLGKGNRGSQSQHSTASHRHCAHGAAVTNPKKTDCRSQGLKNSKGLPHVLSLCNPNHLPATASLIQEESR